MAVRLKSALCAGVVTLLSASAAASAEICVTCTGPDAKYACVVNTSTAGTIDTVVKLYCITALAKAGPHASCAIDRNTKAPCQGVRKELPLPGALEQALDNPQEPQTATPALSSPSPGEPGALPAHSEAAPHGAEIHRQSECEPLHVLSPRNVPLCGIAGDTMVAVQSGQADGGGVR